MRWTIGRKFAAAATSVLSLLLLAGGLGLRAQAIQRDHYDRLANDLRMAQVHSARLEAAVRGQAQSMLGYAVGMPNAQTDYLTYLAETQGAVSLLEARASGDAELANLVSSVRDAGQRFDAHAQKTFQMNAEDAHDALPTLTARLSEYRSAAQAVSGYLEKLANDVVRAADQEVQRIQYIAIPLVCVSLLLTAVVATMLARGIAGPLGQVAQVAGRVADGDLTVPEVKVETQDEIGMMGRSVNAMVRGLRALIAQVAESGQQATQWAEELRNTTAAMSESSRQVADAISEIAQGTATQSQAAAASLQQVRELRQAIGQIAAGAQRQAQQAEAVAADAQQMMNSLSDVAEKSAVMRQIAEQTLSTAQSGKRVVDESLSAMQAIRSSVQHSAELVAKLGDLSGQIGVITDAITEIADQTNLLALNAAIEAARAGDQGRGFAVVAEEVRHLAERVASSAGDIAQLIDQIRTATARAVSGITEVREQVQKGARLAEDGGRALQEIVGMVEETTGHVTAISEASTRLVTVSQGIQKAIDEMAAISGEHTAATEEMARTAQLVAEAFETIAATAEQTAAASQKVAASSEELTAGIEQVSHSARQLADLAGELGGHIGRFRT